VVRRRVLAMLGDFFSNIGGRQTFGHADAPFPSSLLLARPRTRLFPQGRTETNRTCRPGGASHPPGHPLSLRDARAVGLVALPTKIPARVLRADRSGRVTPLFFFDLGQELLDDLRRVDPNETPQDTASLPPNGTLRGFS
jgi:hypothetical protein